MIEKEINCMLIDQLAMLERLEKIATKNNDTEMIDAIENERKVVNQKLYQSPPLQKQ